MSLRTFPNKSSQFFQRELSFYNLCLNDEIKDVKSDDCIQKVGENPAGLPILENLVRAHSSLRDIGIRSHLVELTKNQLLVQASTAIVGQVNLNPQVVLLLLN